MEGLPLLLLYILVLLAQVAMLVRAKQGRLGWNRPLLLEGVSLIAALLLCYYFDRLPGYGMMPGLSYMGETLFSLGAAAVYALMLLLTLLLMGHQKEQ